MAYTKASKYGLVPKSGGITGVSNTSSFNSASLNYSQIARDLTTMVNKPQPSGWLGLWWSNMKLPMINQRLRNVEDILNTVARLNDTVTDMQYKMAVQPAVLRNLIEGHEAEAQRLMEVAIAEHKQLLHTTKQEMLRDEEQTRTAIAEANQAEAETERIRQQTENDKKLADADAKYRDAEADEKIEATEMRKYIRTSVITNVPMEFKVIMSAFVMGGDTDTIRQMHEFDSFKEWIFRMKDEDLNQAKAQTASANAGASKAGHESRSTGYQADMEKKRRDDQKNK